MQYIYKIKKFVSKILVNIIRLGVKRPKKFITFGSTVRLVEFKIKI